jgi:microcystin degradation protein MlrC
MKVLTGLFNTESNANVPVKCTLRQFDVAYGDACITKMAIGEVFEKYGVELIPAIYASSSSAGVIEKATFDFIEAKFLNTLKENLDELDGIYIHLHGASEVEEIGSGEHHILRKMREIVGPYFPIMISCDPHGNLCKEYVESTNLIRSFRESPHVDTAATMQWVAGQMCEFLENRRNIHSVYRKLPLILGGEQTVSADEPVVSINHFMDELEKDERIWSASWHVGYIRHDSPVAGCGIVVVPMTENDQEYAEEIADKLAEYVWSKRREFHYTGRTAQPVEALEMCLEQTEKPAVLTDSGDNMTSGAAGWNTYVLRQVLKQKELKETVLFAGIVDPKAYERLAKLNVGEEASIRLGVDYDEYSKPVDLEVVVEGTGSVYVLHVADLVDDGGKCVHVNVKGTPIDILIQNTSVPFVTNAQFDLLGIDWKSYDLTVFKQGYIFPDYKKEASFYVMSLTGGTTPQDTASIKFKRIMRPMFPIDDI